VFVLNVPLRLLAFLIAVAPVVSAPPPPTIILSPNTIRVGEVRDVKVTGSYFTRCRRRDGGPADSSDVVIHLVGSSDVLGKIAASTTGTFKTPISPLSGLQPNSYEIGCGVSRSRHEGVQYPYRERRPASAPA
jgi:hypothetical protein